MLARISASEKTFADARVERALLPAASDLDSVLDLDLDLVLDLVLDLDLVLVLDLAFGGFGRGFRR
jgi:hypothetical protein